MKTMGNKIYVMTVDEEGEPVVVVDCSLSDTGYILVDVAEQKVELNYYPADKIIKRK